MQVGGQTLCLLCTINFKKAQFKRRQQEGKKKEAQKPSSSSSSTNTRTLKHRDRHRDEE